MKRNLCADVTAALDTLVRGYREETRLYQWIRALTWRQRRMVDGRADLDGFRDLLDQKEDLLRMIGQIESKLRPAKSLVLSRKPSECPDRWQLENVLDRLTETLEEIRTVETANASLLQSVPMAG